MITRCSTSPPGKPPQAACGSGSASGDDAEAASLWSGQVDQATDIGFHGFAVKPCVIIPCYNHVATVAVVARDAQAYCPVMVVNDGSTLSLPPLPGCLVLKLGCNQGKAAALRAGFRHAAELGFTHALTMDADGQHFASDLAQFLAALATQPEALVVGVRDFHAAGCPPHRRRTNVVSTFWYRIETGVRLDDTQCGFRGYPLALTRCLKIRSSRYAYELEFLVRAAWAGTTIVPVAVQCSYAPDQLRQSHFHPLKDLAHITLMNLGLVLQSWCVPRTRLREWSLNQA